MHNPLTNSSNWILGVQSLCLRKETNQKCESRIEESGAKGSYSGELRLG